MNPNAFILKVGRDTLMRSMTTFQLVQKGFLGSQINLNLPMKCDQKPLSPDEVRLWATFERCFCVQNIKSERVLLIQNVC